MPSQKLVAVLLLLSFLSSSMGILQVGRVYADNSIAVPFLEGQGQNPNSSIVLDAFGMPEGASGTYYPAEKNMLLGRTPFLTPLECVKRYGAAFCVCNELQDGTQYCYYSRPPAGYYDTMQSCEAVWGPGYCICPTPDKCRLYDSQEDATPLACQGQVYFFSGEKYECRKSGVVTMGENCCISNAKEDEECSFENLSKKIGLDDLALTAVSLGTKLSSLAGYDVTEMLAVKAAEVVVAKWIETQAVEGLTNSMTRLFGDEITDFVLDTLSEQLADDVIQGAIMDGSLEVLREMAVAEVAAMMSTVVSVAGWAYFAYQTYNMIQMMQTCSAGEYMLGCKIAKGVCHEVGTRCKVKVLGACLQKVDVFCCFSTKLARIINEQGREQIGRGWGSANSPECRGFYVDEFARLDLSRMNLDEYTADLVREMNPNLTTRIEEATKRLQDGLGVK